VKGVAILFLTALLGAPAIAGAAPGVITIDDRNVYPESLDSTPDGTLYISGSNGRIYRSHAGQKYAEPWITPESSGLHPGVRGVVADGKTKTLWVCDNDGKNSAIFRFNLKTGHKRDSFAFPGGGHCNDIAFRAGAAYLTDTAKGRILRLAPGGKALEVWYTNDPSDAALDGIVWSADGRLYVNTVNGNHLIRVDVNADGSAGQGNIMPVSQDLQQPDGLRLTPSGRLLMIEARAKPGPGLHDGRLEEITIENGEAVIHVIQDGFEYPTAVTVTRGRAWVLESKFDYLRNPARKGRDPGLFHIYPVKLLGR